MDRYIVPRGKVYSNTEGRYILALGTERQGIMDKVLYKHSVILYDIYRSLHNPLKKLSHI